VNNETVLDRSLIRISSAHIEGANFEVTMQSYKGRFDQLQYGDDLTTGTWQNVGSAIPGGGFPISFIHAGGATNQQRLHRVMVGPKIDASLPFASGNSCRKSGSGSLFFCETKSVSECV